MREWTKLIWILLAFAGLFFLPVGWARFDNAIQESLQLARWYAREHVLLCLVPAFFIAGGIGVFIRQAAVMRYLGRGANPLMAYGVASVSGSILAVCSCTVLPLFAGIYRMGAGLGPATTFLYAGPAINVLAIILTARILGPQLGLARAVGAIAFSIVIGLAMHLLYRRQEQERHTAQAAMPEAPAGRPLWQTALFFAAMIGVLVFANWGKPQEVSVCVVDRFGDGHTYLGLIERETDRSIFLRGGFGYHGPLDRSAPLVELDRSTVHQIRPAEGLWNAIYQAKWWIASGFALLLGGVLVAVLKIAWWKIALAAVPPALLSWLLPDGGLWVLLPFAAAVIGLVAVTTGRDDEGGQWLAATWDFAKQILPLLLIGVLVAGFLLGRPDREGFIPGRYVEMLVGASPQSFLAETRLAGSGWEQTVRWIWPLWTNVFASVFGAFMYFATLTEVPILQGLIGAGMGKGPALALLLSGPALSLPSMLVIRSVLGARKTLLFVAMVIVMAATSGMIFQAVAGA